MLLVADVKPSALPRDVTAEEQALFGIDKLNVPRSDIPAVTHVDYSARIQTVHADTNPRYHALLSRFKELTGCPVLVNTSFNVRGEPIVCTPEDAFRCFMGTEIEFLAVGDCILRKNDQDQRAGAGLQVRVRTRLTAARVVLAGARPRRRPSRERRRSSRHPAGVGKARRRLGGGAG